MDIQKWNNGYPYMELWISKIFLIFGYPFIWFVDTQNEADIADSHKLNYGYPSMKKRIPKNEKYF